MCDHIVYTYLECGHLGSDGVARCGPARARNENCPRNGWGASLVVLEQENAMLVCFRPLQIRTKFCIGGAFEREVLFKVRIIFNFKMCLSPMYLC